MIFCRKTSMLWTSRWIIIQSSGNKTICCYPVCFYHIKLLVLCGEDKSGLQWNAYSDYAPSPSWDQKLKHLQWFVINKNYLISCVRLLSYLFEHFGAFQVFCNVFFWKRDTPTPLHATYRWTVHIPCFVHSFTKLTIMITTMMSFQIVNNSSLG